MSNLTSCLNIVQDSVNLTLIIEIQIKLGFVESQYVSLSAPKCDNRTTIQKESCIEPNNHERRVSLQDCFSRPQMDFHSLSLFQIKLKRV